MQRYVGRIFRILVSLLIGTVVTFAVLAPTCTIYKWTIAYTTVLQIDWRIEDYRQIHSDKEISIDSLNDWLAGNLSPSDPISLKFGASFGKDPWGNPYVCVRRASDPEHAIGVYSRGEDRTTQSDGNDGDDLNSWNKECYRGYQRKIFLSNAILATIVISLIASVVYAFLFEFCRWFNGDKAKRAKPADSTKEG